MLRSGIEPADVSAIAINRCCKPVTVALMRRLIFFLSFYIFIVLQITLFILGVVNIVKLYYKLVLA